jgi:hypothetical protein
MPSPHRPMIHRTSSCIIWGLVASALLAPLGCGHAAPSEPSCVEGLSTECQPLYDPPTYQRIFDTIFQPTCATGKGTCHTSDGQKAGLVFEDADIAYHLLLGEGGARARVLPKNAACSILEMRVENQDPNVRMPPGPVPLLPSQRCMITQWIESGAAR